MLSREDVERLRPLADGAAQTAELSSGVVGIFNALRLLIEHDAALRAQLAAMTGERDQCYVAYDDRIMELEKQLAANEQRYLEVCAVVDALRLTVQDLRQQLAAAQERVKQLEKVLKDIIVRSRRIRENGAVVKVEAFYIQQIATRALTPTDRPPA